MLLYEMFDAPISGYQSVNQDRSQRHWRETRKSRITLADLHRMNEMLQVRAYEKATNMQKIQDQYGPKTQPMM